MKFDECEECSAQLTPRKWEFCHICSIHLCPDCQINIEDCCYCKECWEDDKKGISMCGACSDKFDKKYLVKCQRCGNQFCWLCMTSLYALWKGDLCPSCIVIPVICPRCRFEDSKGDSNWGAEWCHECWNADRGQRRKIDLYKITVADP